MTKNYLHLDRSVGTLLGVENNIKRCVQQTQEHEAPSHDQGWRLQRHLVKLDVEFSRSTFGPDRQSLDLFQLVCSWAHTGIIFAQLGQFTSGGIPTVCELIQRDANLCEVITRRHCEWSLVATIAAWSPAAKAKERRSSKRHLESLVVRCAGTHQHDKISTCSTGCIE